MEPGTTKRGRRKKDAAVQQGRKEGEALRNAGTRGEFKQA